MNKKEKNQKMKNVRSLIDRIDEKILPLMVKRSILVNKALELKSRKNEIIDRKRINQILKKIKKKSLINNLDPKITTKIWKSIIWAYIDYQRKNFKNK